MYYEGPKGQERAVRQELPDGTTSSTFYYEDPMDQERAVRKELPDGTTFYYEGPKDQERIVRQELSDGAIIYYEGPKGQERAVRQEIPDGTSPTTDCLLLDSRRRPVTLSSSPSYRPTYHVGLSHVPPAQIHHLLAVDNHQTPEIQST